MLEFVVDNWWSNLSEYERILLINLLFKLNLKDYVEVDSKGKYIKLKED